MAKMTCHIHIQIINNRITGKTKNRWVINISDKPLSADEERLLAYGPNYAIVLKYLPIIQYVAAIENACTKLEEGQVDEFRVQASALYHCNMHIWQCNIYGNMAITSANIMIKGNNISLLIYIY